MQQISYHQLASSQALNNPLLQAVAHGLAQLMPLTECETWPQPLLELLAYLESPHTEKITTPPLVIVVGNCPTVTGQAATLLRASALEVVCCDSGEQAVAVLKQRVGDVALIVTDQQLDGVMDGFGLAQALGLLWPGIPVILATEQPNVKPLPIAVTQLDKPWLPLSLLVEAHRALTTSPPLAH
jgi:CheY-like chemotaxis protein